MIRYLNGLNEKDAIHELQFLGISAPDPADVISLQENFAAKVTDLPPEQLQQVRRILSHFEEASIITSQDDHRTADFIFHLSHSQKFPFLKKLEEQSSTEIDSFRRELRTLLENISRKEWVYLLHSGRLIIDRPLIMGILNVTPDSFSDGGKFFGREAGLRHALEMLEAGADIIDIGGESTRPGSEPVSLEEEWKRIAPVIAHLAKTDNCVISVDTCKSEIARRALNEGAHIINDISGMAFDPQMAEVAAENNTPVVLMHLQGTPGTMQKNPNYKNLMEEIFTVLDQRCRRAVERGVRQVIVDPGIGFGKRMNDNFEILRRLGELRSLGYPILLGASRKSFIGNLLNIPPEERGVGTVATALYGVARGANILRVHNVAEIRQSLLVLEAIQNRKAT